MKKPLFIVFLLLLCFPPFFPKLTAQTQPLKPLRIYQDINGNYFFLTKSNDTIYLTPFVKLQRWECFSDLNTSTLFQKLKQLISRFINCETFYNETENKLYIKCKLLGSVIVEIILYPLNITEYGALEWEIKVYRKEIFTVLGNKFVFPFFLKDLKAYYQPPLYEEYGFSEPFSNSTFSVNATHVMRLINGSWINEAYRPANVVGSYAVYHAYKMHNEYKTGKAFHIYRPKIIDAEGNEAWCSLNISNNLLKIEIPQDFLDNAVYPVTIDPTFGYETKGSSFSYASGAYACKFQVTEAGNAESITVYLYYGFGGAGNIKVAIWDSDLNLLSSGESSYPSDVDEWVTISLDSNPSLTANEYYWLGCKTSIWGTKIFFDSGETNQASSQSVDYADYPTNPLQQDSFYARKYSFYCTYTVGAGQEYNVDLNWQSNPSYTVDKKADFTVNPNWNFVSSFNLVKQSIFNVVFQWQTVTSWNLIVNHILGAIQYVVDLSWQTISNWNKILKSTYSLIIPWETSVEWNIIHELTYIINLGWQTSTSWLLDVYHWVSTGITYFVDLSWETISNWTMEAFCFVLEITNIEVLGLAALAFVIGIIALAIAIVNIKNE